MNLSDKVQNEAPFGFLTVRAYTAGEALPVEGATVTVRDGGDGLITEEIVRQTGRSGQTEPIALPAPSAMDSQSPSLTRPYAIYDVTVTHPRFYPFRATGVPVFAGITSLQPVNMVPLTRFDSADRKPEGITDTQNEQDLFDD